MRLRRALGWSQAKLAQFLGVHQGTISRWERGQRPLDPRWQLCLQLLWVNRRLYLWVLDSEKAMRP